MLEKDLSKHCHPYLNGKNEMLKKAYERINILCLTFVIEC